MMVSGLLASSKNNFKIEFEHLNPIENFQDLDLIKKYVSVLGGTHLGKISMSFLNTITRDKIKFI